MIISSPIGRIKTTLRMFQLVVFIFKAYEAERTVWYKWKLSRKNLVLEILVPLKCLHARAF